MLWRVEEELNDNFQQAAETQENKMIAESFPMIMQQHNKN